MITQTRVFVRSNNKFRMAALPQEAIVFRRSVTGQRKSIALSLGGTIADKIQQEQHRSVLDCESQESHDAQQELGNGAEAQAWPIKSRKPLVTAKACSKREEFPLSSLQVTLAATFVSLRSIAFRVL